MTDLTVQDLPELPVATRRATVAFSELPAFFDATLPAVWAAMQAQGLKPLGPPLARYWGMPGESVDVEAGFPVAGFSDTDDIHAGSLPGGAAVVGMHIGPYDTMRASWQAVADLMAERGLSRRDDQCWEIYLSDPGAEPDPATWRTQIVQPVSDPA